MAKKRLSVPLLQGIVTKTTGAHSQVTTEDGKKYVCTFQGKSRIDGNLRSTNPVAVGDKVDFLLSEQEGDLCVIQKVLPRKNYILRKAISYSGKVHILCTNIDQAILLFTIKQPHTTTGFINRFLVIAEAYHIPTTLIINKIDLLHTEEEQEKLADIKSAYQLAGYPVVELSATDSTYLATAKALFSDKTSFLGGHSGAGKSTLINLIEPDLNIRTQQISDYNDKGMHTTTHTEMYNVAGGYVIDAPGIKEMGLVDFDKKILSHYFPEMRTRLSGCKFNNCTHINEPHCAIKDAVEAGEIHLSRYNSYLRMMEDD